MSVQAQIKTQEPPAYHLHLRRYPVGVGIITIWLLGALGLGVAVYRWYAGLGATTNLSDGRPWGLWISFDMMSGIGLAAGAFTVAAVVYIFNLKRFYPIVRPVILTGFISYVLGAFTMLVDLGQPERIWHLLIYWNIHSPLFEIGWCVMAYLTVLALEFSPTVFETLGWKVPLRLIRGIQIPLIIAGVTLSTMHQSTLGTMLLLMTDKVHPLWSSPLLPLYYYLTAIAAGVGMTIFESYHSARAYGFAFERKILSSLSKIVPWVLGIYLVLKLGELFISGNYTYLLKGGAPAIMWCIEIFGGVLIPMMYFIDPRSRTNTDSLVWAAFFTMGGLILNRVNGATIFWDGAFYLPSWSEVAVTVGLTCLGVIIFDAAVRFLPLFPEPTEHKVKHL